MARRCSEAERVAWVRQWRASGLSCARFAARHSLSKATLYTWSHRVGREVPASTLARAGEARRGAQFAQVRVVGEAVATRASRGGLDVVLGNGCLVRVSGVVDESQLRSVLRVVIAC